MKYSTVDEHSHVLILSSVLRLPLQTEGPLNVIPGTWTAQSRAHVLHARIFGLIYQVSSLETSHIFNHVKIYFGLAPLHLEL